MKHWDPWAAAAVGPAAAAVGPFAVSVVVEIEGVAESSSVCSDTIVHYRTVFVAKFAAAASVWQDKRMPD
jgi:hypothetical protein